MIKNKLGIVFYLLTFCSCLLTYENFCVENLTSDMVPTFQRDHVGKMYFDIVFNKCLHHIEMLGPCQTIWIFQICFLSLSWRHCSKKISPCKSDQNKKTRRRKFKKLIQANISPNFWHKSFNLWYQNELEKIIFLKHFGFYQFSVKIYF